jgi:hypothetical protein
VPGPLGSWQDAEKLFHISGRRLTQVENKPLIGVHLRSSAAEYAFSATC